MSLSLSISLSLSLSLSLSIYLSTSLSLNSLCMFSPTSLYEWSTCVHPTCLSTSEGDTAKETQQGRHSKGDTARETQQGRHSKGAIAKSGYDNTHNSVCRHGIRPACSLVTFKQVLQRGPGEAPYISTCLKTRALNMNCNRMCQA